LNEIEARVLELGEKDIHVATMIKLKEVLDQAYPIICIVVARPLSELGCFFHLIGD
jgi:hypothetical protein